MSSVKRDQPQCQKRPTTVSKETYYSDGVVYVISIVALQVEKHLAENSQVRHRTLEHAAGSDNAGNLLERWLQSIHVVDVLERMRHVYLRESVRA